MYPWGYSRVMVNTKVFPLLLLAILAGCSKPGPPSVGLHEAALKGDLDAIRQHIRAGSDLDAKEPEAGSSPLHTAAMFDQVEVAEALIAAGADVDARDDRGSTPLHVAAFLCRTEIVEALLENGADKNARNNEGATALESVSGPFEDVKGIYDWVQTGLGPLGLELNYERIEATRPQIAGMLR